MRAPFVCSALLCRLALCALLVGCGTTSPPAEGDVTSGADVSGQVGPVCSSDSDCPATGDDCTLRRCIAGGCVDIDLSGLPCEDGATCTVGDQCGEGEDKGTCKPGPNLCACAEDADCTGDACAPQVCDKSGFPWACVAKPGATKTCADDGEPCTTARCDPKTGDCVHEPAFEGLGCSDGDPCTAGDSCTKGACVGKPGDCVCATDADCAKHEDGDACNGTLYCDKSGDKPACVVNPKTVVSCPSGKDSACAKNLCDPKTGSCALTPVDEGADCTEPGACTASACKGGACTETGKDLCACKSDADCAKQEDGDLCNGTLYCDLKQGQCVVNPATAITCPTGGDSACVKNVCLPATGACHPRSVDVLKKVCADAKDPKSCAWQLSKPGEVSPKVPCDDGDSCTVGDTCAKGVCTAGPTNTCTCAKDADCAKLEDSNACNGTMFCNLQVSQCQVNPATTVFCPSVDDTECLKNACDPKEADPKKLCKAAPTGQTTLLCDKLSNGQSQCRRELKPKGAPETKDLPCDDGDKCTAGTTCKAGKCQGGADVCKCSSDAECAGQDDGNKCNGLPFCDKVSGLCKNNAALTVVCKTVDNTDCLKMACHPASGQCIPTAAAQAKQLCQIDSKGNKSQCRWEVKGANEPAPVMTCDDGNPCTASDVCVGAVCQGGKSTCECQLDSDCDVKDDGDKCNGTWYCDKTDKTKPKCTFNPASVVVCPKGDDSACAKSLCDKKTGKCGLQATNQGKGCDDGDPCTAGDACNAGGCEGKPNLCNDGDVCTTDSCEKGKGCVHTKANCSDGNACTADQCDAKTGKCDFPTAALDGKSCDADGDPCTPSDVCAKGSCKAGPPVICKVETGVCEQAKCVPAGQGFQCVVVASPEGAPCGDGAGCTVGATCKAGKCAAGSKQRLMHVGRTLDGWQGQLRAVAPAAEGLSLAVGGVWKGAATKPSASGWWWVRYDRAGQPSVAAGGWSLASPQPDPEAGAWDLGLRTDGDALVVGAYRAAGVGLNARVVRVSAASGKVLWTRDVGTQADEVARAVAVEPGGAAVIGGWQGAKPWVARVTAAGSFAWAVTPASAGRVVDVGLGAKGQAELLGRVGTGAQASGRLWSVLPDGKPGTVSATLSRSGGWSPEAFAPATGGWIVAGHTTVQVSGKTSVRAHVARVDDKGAVAWQRATAVAGVATAIVAHGAGQAAGWVVAGSTNPSGANDDAWWARVDASGNQHWDKSDDGGGADRVLGLAVASDGDLVSVGARGPASSGAGEAALLARSDAFGHLSCAEAGGCVGKKPGDCSDGKACTADGCDAKQGCTYTSDDDFVCDPKDGCSTEGLCSKGACKPGPKGKLFTVSFPHSPAWRFVGLAPDAGGGVATLAEQDDFDGSAPRKVWLVRLGATGKLVQSLDLTGPKGSADKLDQVRASALLARPGGGFVAAFGRGKKPYNKPIEFHNQLALVSAQGAVKWVANPYEDKCIKGNVVALRNYPGGDFFSLRSCPGGYAGGHDLYAVRRTAAGDGKWDWYKVARKDIAGSEISPTDALVVGKDAVWISSEVWGGQVPAKAKRNGLLMAIDGNGAEVFRTNLVERAANGLTALAATGDGQVVAAGWREAKGVRRPWLLGFGDKGQVLWHGGPTTGPQTIPTAMAVLSDGALVLTGTQRKGVLEQGWMGRFDTTGSRVSERLIALGTTAEISAHSALVLADDTVMLAGNAAVSGAPVGLLARADRWGHTTCTGSAGCLLKTAKTCADSDPCTAEACTGGKCVATPATCSDGDPCTADACKGGCTHAKGCDDGDPCTRDLCDPIEGCVHVAIAGCQGGDACQVPTCTGGTCDGVVRNGTCYIAQIPGTGGFAKAQATCAASGRKLTSVHDAATNLLLMGLAEGAVGKAYSWWTGLFKDNQSAPWTWLDGSPVDYSGVLGYKPLDPLAAKYKRQEVIVTASGTWYAYNQGSNLNAVAMCGGISKTSCTTKAAPDGTPCGSGKTCKAGTCQ